MKFLIEEASGKVKAGMEFPLDFSVSGHFVVDSPTSLGVVPDGNVLSNLLARKLAAYKAANPTLPYSLNDEFLTAAGVDTTLSDGVLLGSNKRVGLLPSGRLQTTLLTALNSFSSVLLHFHLFSLCHRVPAPLDDSPGPKPLLYSYDPGLSGYAEPALSSVTAELMDPAGAVSYLTFTPDVKQSFPQAAPYDFRIRFTNTTSRILFLSDWTFLSG